MPFQKGHSINKGIKQTKEHISKIVSTRKKNGSYTGKNMLGRTPWNKGIPMKKEVKKKISDSRKNKCVGDFNPMKKIENRKKISVRQKGSNNSMFGKSSAKTAGSGKGSWYLTTYQGYVWLRSSYELAYTKWLDKNNRDWLYEAKIFKLDNGHTYTPDFYLIHDDKYIDTKGYLREKQRINIERFTTLYPNENFEILFKQDLLKLGVDII